MTVEAMPLRGEQVKVLADPVLDTTPSVDPQGRLVPLPPPPPPWVL